MAHSPSPTSPLTGYRGRIFPNTGRSLSGSPPPAEPVNKRYKRRKQHADLQENLMNEFNSNREQHYRAQLIALQHDMNLITQADPYDPEPLEDSPDEIARIAESAASGTAYQSEMSSLAGKWYAEFVHEINDAKEAKELDLIQLKNNHDARLERLRFECDYRLHLAAEECEHMTSTLRERLVLTLSQKRARLMKEKEQLDIADTNALLLHPSQFTITNPASPGGGMTRKTRLTRHRGEHEEANAAVEISKRKRKLADLDDESPSRNGHATPAERTRATNTARQTGPLYSINTLFTEKELNYQSHQAQIAARHFFATSHKEGEATTSKTAKEDDTLHSREDSGAEEDDELEAPSLDRTASQNVHVTRSTRNIGAMAGLNILSDLAEKVATRPALPYATLHTTQGRTGTFLPQPSRLIAEELEEDLFKLAQVESQPQGFVDRRAMDDALKPIAEGRSNLAPDWPAYLDAHLVEIDPRRTAGVS